jgi:hypothetical protein
MNIQDEMNRIFKMQKDNLATNGKKAIPRWGTQVLRR